MEIYPLNIIEIKLQARVNQVDLDGLKEVHHRLVRRFQNPQIEDLVEKILHIRLGKQKKLL